MTERVSLDDMTSDQLDQLHNRATTLATELAEERRLYDLRTQQVQRLVRQRHNAEHHAEQLAATLDEILRHFTHPGHPGEPCLSSGWISVKTVERWRAAAHPPATDAETTTRVIAALHHSAEQDISRVISLYEQWCKAGAPPLGKSLARWWDARLVELHEAIVPTADEPARTTANNQPPPVAF